MVIMLAVSCFKRQRGFFSLLQGNGKDEVVCCSWDGQTYIVNLGREAVRYQFEDNVTAFTAGGWAESCLISPLLFDHLSYDRSLGLPQGKFSGK